jgi:hypothetical protein
MADTNNPPTNTESAEPPPAADGPLGEGGKAALQAERRARQEAERQAREAQERLRELEAADARRAVATEKQLTPQQAELLTGATREEMTEQADRLLEAFRAPEGEGAPGRGRPRERLKSGAVPSADSGPSAAEVADDVLKGW